MMAPQSMHMYIYDISIPNPTHAFSRFASVGDSTCYPILSCLLFNNHIFRSEPAPTPPPPHQRVNRGRPMDVLYPHLTYLPNLVLNVHGPAS
jgi:hypothetical protein